MKVNMSSKATKEMIERAVRASCRLEGLDYDRAIKDIKMINLLKKHGRAFSIEPDVEELHFKDKRLNKEAKKLAKLLK